MVKKDNSKPQTPDNFDPTNPMYLPNFGLSCRVGRLVNILDAAVKAKCLELKNLLLAFQIINALNEYATVGKDNWEQKLPAEYRPNHFLDYRISIRNKLWMEPILEELLAKGKGDLAKKIKKRRDELLAEVDNYSKNLDSIVSAQSTQPLQSKNMHQKINKKGRPPKYTDEQLKKMSARYEELCNQYKQKSEALNVLFEEYKSLGPKSPDALRVALHIYCKKREK